MARLFTFMLLVSVSFSSSDRFLRRAARRQRREDRVEAAAEDTSRGVSREGRATRSSTQSERQRVSFWQEIAEEEDLAEEEADREQRRAAANAQKEAKRAKLEQERREWAELIRLQNEEYEQVLQSDKQKHMQNEETQEVEESSTGAYQSTKMNSLEVFNQRQMPHETDTCRVAVRFPAKSNLRKVITLRRSDYVDTLEHWVASLSIDDDTLPQSIKQLEKGNFRLRSAEGFITDGVTLEDANVCDALLHVVVI